MKLSRPSWSDYFSTVFGFALLAALPVVVDGAVSGSPPGPQKRMPPAGIEIPADKRAALTADAALLRQEIDTLARTAPSAAHAWLPDVEVLHKAVDWALRYDEFFSAPQMAFAHKLLQEGHARAQALAAGKTPWREATGQVIRGYRSRLDGSVQPYGLVIPASWNRRDPTARRLDVVLPGRNPQRTELAFMADREKSPGEIVPPEGIVLHAYGRFCNATKFAGEVDVFEALDAVRRDYPIDERRLVLRGFSMGGASTWHLATHHSGTWTVTSPGAGFVEAAIYTSAFAGTQPLPTWWEQKLWHLYSATSYAGNLFNCPPIAYSGEIDAQKQAADLMELAMKAEGLKMEHLIGPQTGHKYHPETKQELIKRLETRVAQGRELRPKEVRVTTYTLRYPRVAWVQIDGLVRHWERSDVRARIESPEHIAVETQNVTALSLDCGDARAVSIDGDRLNLPAGANRTVRFARLDGRWSVGARPGTRLKAPGSTGPIDDAFMESFVFVRPTGQPLSPLVGQWTQQELAHATKMWRDIFRGEAPVIADTAVSPADISDKNLILWGDPASNRFLAKIMARLPVSWNAQRLVFHGRTYPGGNHAPILIFPNPLNPKRYIVVNSGIDFREHAYGTNSLQIPKLPDYAIVDLSVPADSRWPGKIMDAGFFDETWTLPR